MRATWMIVLLLLAVCVIAVASTTEPTDAQTAQQQAEVPLVIPSAAKARPNPLQATPENLERGFNLFTSQCAMCHGPLAKGNGDLAVRLGMTMPDFSDPAVQKKRTDGELFYILTQGHGRMPAEGDRLPEDYRWSMILALRSMARGTGSSGGR